MPARYWRLCAIRPHGGGDLELSEIHLYAGANRVDGIASMSATAGPIAGTLANLSDGTLNSTARFAAGDVRSPGFALVWDFGASPQAVIALRFGAGASKSRFVAFATLQSSNDGLTWDSANTVGQIAWPGAFAFTGEPGAGSADPYAASVTLLLRQDLTDASPAGVVFSPGSATVANGIAFPGTGMPAEATNGLSGFAFPGDFTIEFTATKVGNGNSGYDGVMATTDNGSATNGLLIELSSNRGLYINAHATTLGSYNINPNDGAPRRIAVSRVGSVIRTYVELSKVDERTYASAIGAVAFGLGNGAIQGNPTYPFSGTLADVRVTKGVGRYTGSTYTPDPFDSSPQTGPTELSTPEGAFYGRRSVTGVLGATGADFGKRSVALRLDFAGRGVITSTVKEKHSPIDLPLRRRVRLFDQFSGVLVAQTWSSATGVYTFADLDPSREYLAVADDHERVYRSVAASYLVPQVAA